MMFRRYYGSGRFFDRDFDRYFYGHHFDRFGSFGLWHILMMLGFVLLIVLLVILIVKKSNGRHNHPVQDDHLKKMLDERFVRGEITEEEYQQKLRVLGLKQ